MSRSTLHIAVAAVLSLNASDLISQKRPSDPRQVTPQLSASPANPLYLYAHFRDDDETRLRLSWSHNPATFWHDVNSGGSFKAHALRDPSVMYVPGTGPSAPGIFCFLATPSAGTKVQFFTSTDLITFSAITTIDLGSMISGATVAWAPEWWHDPRNGSYYFFIAVSLDRAGAVSSTARMAPWLVPFDPLAARVTTPPVPLELFGTTQNRTFDYYPYYDGAKYHLLYVDQQPGGVGGNVTQPIAWATAPDLAGPYTQQTFRGTDYFGLGTFQAEAPALVDLGTSGCVRLVFDTWTVSVTGARQYHPVYRDSCESAGSRFSQTSLINGPSPLSISAAEHGTIIPLTDPNSAAIVLNAAAATQPQAATRTAPR